MAIQQPVTFASRRSHATRHWKFITAVTQVSLNNRFVHFCFLYVFLLSEERPFKCSICDRGFSTKVSELNYSYHIAQITCVRCLSAASWLVGWLVDRFKNR